MATEQADERAEHLRSVTVTSLAAIAGVAAAIGSSLLTAGMEPAAAATNTQAQLVVGVAILIQLPIVRVLGFYEDGPGAKDVLFIAFMTFSLWFVTWGIILMTGASF